MLQSFFVQKLPAAKLSGIHWPISVHKWLVGDVLFYLKFWAKVTHSLGKRRLPIDIRS